MRSDVRSAALRAATKVAFSMAFVSGCSSPPDADPTTGSSPDDVEPGTAESGYSTRKKPCHTKADAGAKPSCESVVASAFPTDGNYPGAKQSVSHEVQTCCVELLTKSQGSLAVHRWDCCANLPADAGQTVGIACTPWGPPVPPSMMRRRIRNLARVVA